MGDRLRSLEQFVFKPTFSLMVYVIGDRTPRKKYVVCAKLGFTLKDIAWIKVSSWYIGEVLKINRAEFSKDKFLMSYGLERRLKCTDKVWKIWKAGTLQERNRNLQRSTNWTWVKIVWESFYLISTFQCSSEWMSLGGRVVTLLLRWRTGASSGYCI